VKSKLLKIAFYAVLAIAILAVLAPYIPAAFLRSRVESALSSSLNRAVNIGDIRFTFFPSGPVPGPGFALENVTIHEDPRAGIEPFAYMTELGASIRILSLLGGSLELSGINLNEASINLVKTEQGQWNFQYLLDSLKAQEHSMPAFRMRGGRVNFKFGETKSVFFFNAADIDISPNITGATSGGMTLRFSGEPSRTDHTKQDFGRFFIRGTSSASNRLDLSIELQRSSLEETLRLMDPQGFGVHGILAINGRVTGAPSQLDLTGNVEIGDIHRSDLLPQEGQAWKLPFKGLLDLPGARFDIESTDDKSPVGMKFHAQDYLSKPVWTAAAELRAMPLSTLFALGRHMGATLPESLTVEGSVSGSAAYAQAGLSGQLTVSEASLTLPDNDPLKAASATLDIHDGAIHLAPATILVSPTQAAQIEGNVALASPHALDLRITTRGLSVAAMKSFGLPKLPVIGESLRGTWSGWARYQNGKWSSESQVRDASITADGFAAPVELATATISLAPNRLTVTRIVGKLGETAFTGSYETRGSAPARFAITIPEANTADVERVLTPTLARAGPGLIDRTLRRNTATLPAWLKARKAEGTIAIDNITTAEWRARELKARVQWDGPILHLSNATAQISVANFAGSLDIDLTTPSSKYHLAGTISGIPYRGGLLDLTGTADAEGSDVQLLQTAKAEGTAKGRNLAFTSDADFRTFSANFQMQPIGASPRWKLSNVEVTQGLSTLLGTGSTQDDGQLILNLGASRYAALLFPPRTAK
jgi:hypothetical protein